jgi:hypothetical protein
MELTEYNKLLSRCTRWREGRTLFRGVESDEDVDVD